MTPARNGTGPLAGPAHIDWEYDLNGNIRHMAASYRTMNDQGDVSTAASTQDYWYLYDNMNRFTATKAMLVVTDSTGMIQSNANGQLMIGELARGNANAKISAFYHIPVVGPVGSSGTNGVGQGQVVTWYLSGDRKSSTNYSYATVGGGRADFSCQ